MSDVVNKIAKILHTTYSYEQIHTYIARIFFSWCAESKRFYVKNFLRWWDVAVAAVDDGDGKRVKTQLQSILEE